MNPVKLLRILLTYRFNKIIGDLMEENIDVYLEILQEMKEDDFSRNIIIPLFKAMGCGRVDFHGGPYENGKDVIAQQDTAFESHLYVVQSKKIGDGKATSDKEVLGTLLFQLIQCYYNEIPLINGEKKRPNSVFLATPYKIGSRLLAEIHGFLNNPDKPLKLLDGPKLVQQIKKYKPELFESLLNIDKRILIQDRSQLVNLELMTALSQHHSVHEVHYYNDLAFFMGAIDSNILIKSEFEIKPEMMCSSKEDWDVFKTKYLKRLETNLGINPLTQSVEEIEGEFNRLMEMHLSSENKNILDKISSHSAEITLLINTLENIKSDITIYYNSDGVQKNNDLKVIIEDWFNLAHKSENIEDILKTNDNTAQLTSLTKQKGITTIFSGLFRNYTSTLSMLTEEYEIINIARAAYIRAPTVDYYFDSTSIQTWLHINQEKYISSIEVINSGENINKDNLRAFLKKTKNTLAVLEILKELSESLGMTIIVKQNAKHLKDGISITPFTLFDTDFDIAVYGGAGAGKTTTLQMYAKKLLDERKNIVIYLPLNRLINKKSINVNITRPEDIGYKQILALVLISKDMDDTNENIENLDTTLRTASLLKLIIDGLDEAYNKTPHIIKSINSFKERYPNIQLIISSRDCVSYLSEINFLGVTLLPFTTYQLENFIRAWFQERNEVAESLIEDISKNSLKEIVKTPLLATLLCILKDKGIDTPSTEMEIFTRRLHLLCGEYDNYKIIKRTKLDSHILEMAARKIGFHLHNKNKRNESKKNIISYLIHDSTFNYNDETSNLVVEELINPCNILYYDALTDNFSLGHLRFQEHLAALEHNDNRSREITPLMNKDWWRGPLCLYAQAREISSLIEEYCKDFGEVSPAVNILKEMINHRPVSERGHLRKLLLQYEKTDIINDVFAFNSYDEASDEWHYVKASGSVW